MLRRAALCVCPSSVHHKTHSHHTNKTPQLTMMQLLRLALATATIWGVTAIPFVNSVKVGDKVSTSYVGSGVTFVV